MATGAFYIDSDQLEALSSRSRTTREQLYSVLSDVSGAANWSGAGGWGPWNEARSLLNEQAAGHSDDALALAARAAQVRIIAAVQAIREFLASFDKTLDDIAAELSPIAKLGLGLAFGAPVALLAPSTWNALRTLTIEMEKLQAGPEASSSGTAQNIAGVASKAGSVPGSAVPAVTTAALTMVSESHANDCVQFAHDVMTKMGISRQPGAVSNIYVDDGWTSVGFTQESGTATPGSFIQVAPADHSSGHTAVFLGTLADGRPVIAEANVAPAGGDTSPQLRAINANGTAELLNKTTPPPISTAGISSTAADSIRKYYLETGWFKDAASVHFYSPPTIGASN